MSKVAYRHLVNGFRIRDFIGLPIGGKKVIIRMKVQRYQCKNKDCDYDRQEDTFCNRQLWLYPPRFAKYVVDLLRGMTLKDAANLLGRILGYHQRDTYHHLENHYAPPSLEGRSIGIDEFAVRKRGMCTRQSWLTGRRRIICRGRKGYRCPRRILKRIDGKVLT